MSKILGFEFHPLCNHTIKEPKMQSAANVRKIVTEFYLDWVNNYMTIAKIAEDYGMRQSDVIVLINMGRRYHEDHLDFKNGFIDQECEATI